MFKVFLSAEHRSYLVNDVFLYKVESERIIRYFIMARKRYRLVLESNATSWDQIAQVLGLSSNIYHAIFCLNFLAPDIVAGIINEHAPPGFCSRDCQTCFGGME